jgi:hypothetical protein
MVVRSAPSRPRGGDGGDRRLERHGDVTARRGGVAPADPRSRELVSRAGRERWGSVGRGWLQDEASVGDDDAEVRLGQPAQCGTMVCGMGSPRRSGHAQVRPSIRL